MVSVVIPAYNQPTYLRRALTSAWEQTYRPIEVIVVDDCSPNSLEPVIGDFARMEDEQFNIRYFRQAQNLGVIENFHSGVAQAKGKYLVPLPHDNRFTDKRFFEESVEIMSRQSRLPPVLRQCELRKQPKDGAPHTRCHNVSRWVVAARR